MDVTPLIPKDRQIISRYGDGGFVINEVAYKGSILLMPERVISWDISDLTSASAESFSAIFSGELPEIVLIGAGAKFAPLPSKLKEFMRVKGVSCDSMDTGAACRTYSVLLTEGRQVSAALIAV